MFFFTLHTFDIGAYRPEQLKNDDTAPTMDKKWSSNINVCPKALYKAATT